jgi:hypothetical protein
MRCTARSSALIIRVHPLVQPYVAGPAAPGCGVASRDYDLSRFGYKLRISSDPGVSKSYIIIVTLYGHVTINTSIENILCGKKKLNGEKTNMKIMWVGMTIYGAQMWCTYKRDRD